MAFHHVIGYKHQDMSDIGGNCPCKDPGNYVCMEFDDLDIKIICWCGRNKSGNFDTEEERDEFIRKHT